MSWEFEEEQDFTSTEPVSTGKPPNVSGAYHVKIGSSELAETEAGNERVRWTNTVLDGPFKSCEIFDGINLPTFDKAKTNKFMRSLWMNVWISVGHDKKKAQKYKKIKSKYIDGKSGYILFTTKEDTGTDFSEVQWITKAQYDKLDKPEARPEGFEDEPEGDDGDTDFEDDDDSDDGDDGDPLDDL